MANRFLNNISINDSYSLPASDGTADQIIVTDGAGNLSFIDTTTIAVGESEQVHIACKNTSTVTIAKGDPVYITGTVGTSYIVEIAKADASDPAKMPAVGLVETDLVTNAEGFVIVSGVLKNVTTDPLSSGDGTPSSNDTVYVKAGGGLTRTKPTGSGNLIQNVGKVGRVQGTSAGSIAVSTIMRTNDVPNLPVGKIWVGTSTYTDESTVVHIDETNKRLGVGTTTPAQTLDVQGSVKINNAIYDSTNSPGTSGQVLSSTVTGTQWTTAAGGGNISGSGTNDEYAIFTGTNTIGTGNISQNIAGDIVIASGSDVSVTNADINLTGGRVVMTNAGITQTENGTSIVDVLDASDLPSTLAANTTYVIHGNLTVTSAISVTNEGCCIKGRDRNKDRITFSAKSATFLTITDVSFAMQDITIASTDSTSALINATNVAASGYNNGRDSFFTLVNCQFRNVVGDLMDIKGFDLVDFNNTTFFYVESPNYGCRFQDVSKLEISSCEFIRWFSESSLPTPSGYATCDMIELQANNLASFGAVNINGCIIHPQQTQNGLNISTLSTTGFGTIAANAFVDVGLTTGSILAGSDYNDTSMLTYDVFANQGLADSTAYLYGYQSGTNNQQATTSFQALTISTFIAPTLQRFTPLTNGIRYDGTKPLTITFNCSLDVTGVGGNNEQFEFQLYKLIGGTLLSPIAGSTRLIELDAGEIGGPALFATTTVNQNDVLTVYYRSPTNDNFTLANFSIQAKQ